MVTARIVLDGNGCIQYAEATGHAGGALKGTNIACAGVTLLMRTAARLLEEDENIIIQGEAPFPGKLYFQVDGYPEEKTERMKGITSFLCLGLQDLKRDFSSEIDVCIEIGKELIDGT